MKESIRIMSYNIRSCLGMDEKIDIARVAAVIAREKPDICGLQEVKNYRALEHGDSPAELGRMTGMKPHFAKTQDRHSSRDDCEYGIASLTSLPAESSEVIDLPCPKGCELRVAQIHEIKREGGAFLFINTHFSYEDGLEEERLAQMRTILNYVEKHRDIPAVLVGDFNARPDEPCVRLLKNDWTIINPCMLTYPVNDADRQIDYIAIRPANAFAVTNVRRVDERLASDHFPVVAEFEFVPEK